MSGVGSGSGVEANEATGHFRFFRNEFITSVPQGVENRLVACMQAVFSTNQLQFQTNGLRIVGQGGLVGRRQGLSATVPIKTVNRCGMSISVLNFFFVFVFVFAFCVSTLCLLSGRKLQLKLDTLYAWVAPPATV